MNEIDVNELIFQMTYASDFSLCLMEEFSNELKNSGIDKIGICKSDSVIKVLDHIQTTFSPNNIKAISDKFKELEDKQHMKGNNKDG